MAMRENVGSEFNATLEKASRSFIEDISGPQNYKNPTNIRLTDNQAWAFWEFNPILNSVVNRITADCTKVKPVVRVRGNHQPTDRQKRRIKRVENLLNNPNENVESFSDIREKTLRDMLVIGRGAIEKVFDDETEELSELYSMVARNLKIRSDEFGNIPQRDAYKMERFRRSGIGSAGNADAGKQVQFFDLEEVIFLVYQPVSWSLYGHKPTDTLANTVASDIMRSMYNSVFFANNGEASGILSLDGLTKTELKKFKKYFQSFHKGAAQAHRTMAVNVPVNWVQMAVTNRDMQFQEYGTELRQRILAVYNMQPLIMGILDGSTGRLNSEQQVQSYKDGALFPILRKESYYYTQHICWDGFSYFDLEIVFPDVDLLDPKTQSDIDRQDVISNIITINEVRRRRLMPDVPWGDSPVNLDPGGGQIDPVTGEVDFPQKEGETGDSGTGNGSEEEKSVHVRMDEYADKLKKEAVVTFDYRNGFSEADKKDFIASVGHTFYEGKCKSLQESAACEVLLNKVTKELQENNFGSLDDLIKKIDNIIRSNKKSKVYSKLEDV
jgi:HK97 family phage portal protein